VEAGFFREKHRAMLIVDDGPARLIERMRGYRAPHLGKWIDSGNR